MHHENADWGKDRGGGARRADSEVVGCIRTDRESAGQCKIKGNKLQEAADPEDCLATWVRVDINSGLTQGLCWQSGTGRAANTHTHTNTHPQAHAHLEHTHISSFWHLQLPTQKYIHRRNLLLPITQHTCFNWLDRTIWLLSGVPFVNRPMIQCWSSNNGVISLLFVFSQG